MDKDPVVFRTLTPEEKDSIPPQIIQKIEIEIRNHHKLYQTTIDSFKRKLGEYEVALRDSKICNRELENKIKQIQIENHLVDVERSVLKSKVESLEKEVEFVKKVNKKKPNRVLDTETIKKDYENKKEEVYRLLGSLVHTEDGSMRDLERANRLLSNKVNDLKKQLTYLLESSSSPVRGGDEAAQQKQNLIKIIQTLSKENDRLNELKSRDLEVGSFREVIKEKDKTIGELQEEISRLRFGIQDEMNKEKQALLNEYDRVCKEKNDLYHQFLNVYNSKVVLEKKSRDLEEEVYKRKVELESTKEQVEGYKKIVEKYNEVNNELIKSNVVIREYRLKIVDLTKKLEESEERYSKYILSNRTDIVAILGRELGYIRRKVVAFADEFGDVDNLYSSFITEQDKLTEMYKSRCKELEGYKDQVGTLKNRQVVLDNFLQVIPTEMMSTLSDLYDTLTGIFQDVSNLFDFSERTTHDFKETIFLLHNDIADKENIIKSLIDNNYSTFDGLIKNENQMLKNEIVLLNSKIDNLQSEEYSTVIDKLDQIRTENENLREYVSNLNTEIVNKDQVVRSLENNLQQVKEKLGNRNSLIDRYEKIIEKLRKIKDEYVKLKKEHKLKKEQKENESKGHESKGDHDKSKGDDSSLPKCNLYSKPILSTETFSIPQDQSRNLQEKK